MDNSRSCDSFHLLLLHTVLPNLTMRWKPDEKPWTRISPKLQKLREAAPEFLSESKGFLYNLHLDLFVTMRTISAGEQI